MNMHEKFAPLEEVTSTAKAFKSAAWLPLVGAKLSTWLKSWADHWVAAAAYDDLSRLSDGELKHRSLSRDILARDIGAWRGGVSGN